MRDNSDWQLGRIIIDFVLMMAAYFAAIYIRYDLMDGYYTVDPRAASYVLMMAVYVVTVIIFQYISALYSKRMSWPQKALRILGSHAVGLLLLIGLLYMMKIFDFSRLAMLLFAAISTLLVCLHHAVPERFFTRGESTERRRMIVIGSGHLARQYMEDVRNHPEWGCDIAGYVSADAQEGVGQCLGNYEDIAAILTQYPQDEVVVALEEDETKYLMTVLAEAEKEGTLVHLIPFYNDAIPSNAAIQTYEHSRLIDMRYTRLDNPGNALMKRTMDLVGSAFLILLTSPLMLITAILVRLSSPGPIIFTQQRIGKNKVPFTMYKFRSMAQSGREDTAWSTAGDPRKTGIGRWIRRYSIDELPQLFNVLKGDMSLVGPRPEIPFHVNHFKNEISRYLLRQQVKPGMTGWAQVNGLRGDTSIQSRINFDLWYIENWSLALDIKILLLTATGGIVNREEK